MRSELEWLAIRAAVWHFSRGDIRSAARDARRLAGVSRPFLRWHWDWAVRNLELVYGPNLSASERGKLARLSIEHQFLSVLDGFRARDIEVAPIDARPLRALVDAYGGAILCTIHLGGWEAGLRALAESGIPMAALYRRPEDSRMANLFARVREGSPVQWISTDRVGAALRALRSGKLLALLIDADIGEATLPVRFLGIDVLRPSGAGRIAARCQVPLVPSLGPREPSGRIAPVIGSPILPETLRDKDAAARMTQRVYGAFEAWIHEWAEQFAWLNPHWRRRPDGTIWTLRDPIEAMRSERREAPCTPSARVRALLASA